MLQPQAMQKTASGTRGSPHRGHAVGTAGVVSDTTHPFTVAQGAAYQFKLTSASRPTFTGNNANFTIAYVSNSGNDWFFKVTAAGAAGASTTFSANGVVVTTATIA